VLFFALIFFFKFIMFHYLQLMVKEEWKMKVDQSVGFFTLTLLPKVSIMAVDYFSVKFF